MNPERQTLVAFTRQGRACCYSGPCEQRECTIGPVRTTHTSSKQSKQRSWPHGSPLGSNRVPDT
eukprot:758976-Hanusia_phi.AAC.4